MSSGFLRFKHVFGGLMLLSAVSAFAIPDQYTRQAHPMVQGIFAPVSGPTRAVAGWADRRLFPAEDPDRRTAEQLRLENEELQVAVAKLEHDLEELRKLDEQLARLGELRDRCKVVRVTGKDLGSRQSLALLGSSLQGIEDGQYALHPGGVVGVVGAGVVGMDVRLITDRGFRVEGYFRGPPKAAAAKDDKAAAAAGGEGARFVRLDTPNVLLEGDGKNGMLLRTNLVLAELEKAGVAEGAWVVVEDSQWPPELQGWLIGKVTRVEARRDAPQFADVRVEPTTDLRRLSWVTVLLDE